MTAARAVFDRATLAFLGVLIAATWARIALLHVNPLGLGVDEAQYWLWSRSFDWGYFTKPPLIAWVIGATTALFGDAEWAIRLGAPIAHALCAIAVFALGRSVYGAWVGFWSGFGWLMLPGVFFSSNIISTDALLLPLWAFALFSMWRLMATRSWTWAIVLGLAVGLGSLAKYAMLYFVLCTACAAWWLAPVRATLAKGRGIVAAVVALLVLSPNIYWNVENGFATARHTASNARFSGAHLFNFDELIEFIGGQIGVIGPLIFLPLLWLLWRAMRRSSGLQDQDKFLLAYILPPLLIVTLIAFISRANANWAAVAYPGIIVWVTGSLFATMGGRRLLAIATAINIVLGSALAAVAFDPALSNRFKGIRTARGWDDTAHEIALRAAAQPGDPPFTAVMTDDRDTYFELNYYWRHARRAGAPLPPVRMWVLNGAHNSAEANDPMREAEGGRVLVVHMRPDYLPFVAGDFTVFRTVEHLTVPLGGSVNRELEISVGEGFAPAPRDAAFQERFSRRGEQH